MKKERIYKNKTCLYKEYIIKKKPIGQIARESNFAHGTIFMWLEKFNIPRRTKSEIFKNRKFSSITIEKMRQAKLRILDKISGPNNPNWKGGRRLIGGYVLTYKPTHPNANKHGCVREHRLVMEGKLKRYLNNKEIVHHADKNTLNNHLGNLILMTQGQHIKEHKKLGDTP